VKGWGCSCTRPGECLPQRNLWLPCAVMMMGSTSWSRCRASRMSSSPERRGIWRSTRRTANGPRSASCSSPACRRRRSRPRSPPRPGSCDSPHGRPAHRLRQGSVPGKDISRARVRSPKSSSTLAKRPRDSTGLSNHASAFMARRSWAPRGLKSNPFWLATAEHHDHGHARQAGFPA